VNQWDIILNQRSKICTTLYSASTKWFKYDWDWFVQTYTQISPGHIWTTLYLENIWSDYRIIFACDKNVWL